MEAPIQAMGNLCSTGGLRVLHTMSCDINPHARKTITANFPVAVMYDDLTTRNNKTAPDCDVYISGFPCQPFSAQGLHQGFEDTKGRGIIFFHCREYIKQKEPKVFVFENVKGLLCKNMGDYFASILKALDDLAIYNVHYRILDTKEHGVPHSRQRCYIVGIRKDVDKGNFAWPDKIEMPSIEDFLEARDPRIASKGAASLPPKSASTARKNVINALRRYAKEDPFKETFIVDCDSTVSRSGTMKGLSPCITCGRGKGHWVTSRGRRLLKEEMFRLQGMNPSTFKVAVPESELGKQLGNTMSVNVLERLFVRLLPAAGLCGSLRDRWADGSALKVLRSTRGKGFARHVEEASAPRTPPARAARALRSESPPTPKRKRGSSLGAVASLARKRARA